MLKENLLTIEIIDNGTGFNIKNKFGNGMNNMKNRIEEIGGSFEITSNAGTAITITCNV